MVFIVQIEDKREYKWHSSLFGPNKNYASILGPKWIEVSYMTHLKILVPYMVLPSSAMKIPFLDVKLRNRVSFVLFSLSCPKEKWLHVIILLLLWALYFGKLANNFFSLIIMLILIRISFINFTYRGKWSFHHLLSTPSSDERPYREWKL